MKRIIIVVAVIVMLMGGGISVMKSMQIGPFAPAPGAAPNSEAAPPPDHDLEEITIALEPLTIPIFQGDKISTILNVEIHILAMGDDNAAEVKKYKPKIADIFLRDLHGYLPRLVEKQGELDVELIIKRLNRVSKRDALLKGMIHRVIIQAISDTPVSIN